VFGGSIPKLAEEEENESYQNAADISKKRSVFLEFLRIFASWWYGLAKTPSGSGTAHGIITALALSSWRPAYNPHWDVPRNKSACPIQKKRG
jgi:hypothetical protein